MNNNPNTPPTTPSTQMICAQTISAQMIPAQMISAGIVPSGSSRLAAVPVGDIDATIAIMDVVASFCATDPAGERLARLFGPAVNALDIATLTDALAATFTERLTNHGPSTRSQS
jgi:hypothetical protein